MAEAEPLPHTQAKQRRQGWSVRQMQNINNKPVCSTNKHRPNPKQTQPTQHEHHKANAQP